MTSASWSDHSLPYIKSMGVGLIRRLRDEFTDMPALCLTEAQARRLFSVDASTCAAALRALVMTGFSRTLDNGSSVSAMRCVTGQK